MNMFTFHFLEQYIYFSKSFGILQKRNPGEK
jgi:hypothetical protein